MIAAVKQVLFTGWHLMRWLRLGLGIFITVQAIQNHDPFSGFIAAFLLFQAVTNTGCCGVSGCAVPVSKDPPGKTVDPGFEEKN
ncbi:MAG TPA: hypothetical protein VIV35_07490 [Chitinophagaceae bacterium]